MRKESLSQSEYQQLRIDRDRLGKCTNAIGMGATSIVSGAAGYAIIEGIRSQDGALLLVSALVIIGGKNITDEVPEISQSRADALSQLTDGGQDLVKCISFDEYSRAQQKPMLDRLNEVGNSRLINVLVGVGGYGLINAIANGDTNAALLFAGIFSYFTFENISLGMRSDRRRELLKKLLRRQPEDNFRG